MTRRVLRSLTVLTVMTFPLVLSGVAYAGTNGRWTQAEAVLADGTQIVVYTIGNRAEATVFRQTQDGECTRTVRGNGPVSLTFSESLRSAHASGEFGGNDVIECPDFAIGGTFQIGLSLEWVTTSALEVSRTVSPADVPDPYAEHARYWSRTRSGTVGGTYAEPTERTVEGAGRLGEIHFSDH